MCSSPCWTTATGHRPGRRARRVFAPGTSRSRRRGPRSAARAATGARRRRRRRGRGRRRDRQRRAPRAAASRRKLTTVQAAFRWRASTLRRMRKMLNKVPEVTLYFWVIKVLSTTVGETARRQPQLQPQPGAQQDHVRDERAAPDRARGAVRDAEVRATRVLGGRCAHQHRRHADHGQPGRQLRGGAGGDHDPLQPRPRDHVRRLVPERGNALDPHDLDDSPRGVLLARDPVHVRARHGGGRPGRRAFGLGYRLGDPSSAA